MKKGYMIKEGRYGTDWEIREPIVFPTKKSLHEHMNKSDIKFTPKLWPGANKYLYCNDDSKWGFTIEEVTVLEHKNEDPDSHMWWVIKGGK